MTLSNFEALPERFRAEKQRVQTRVPNRVRKIEKEAFLGCSSLTDITLPGSFAIIEKSAFAGCRALTSVRLLGRPQVEEAAFDGNPKIERGMTRAELGKFYGRSLDPK